LGGGPPCFPQGSSCPVVLRMPSANSDSFAYRGVTVCAGAFQPASAKVFVCSLRVLQPQPLNGVGLGSSLFARRYWGNRGFFLFLRVLRCFSSPGSLRCAYLVRHRVTEYYFRRVAPFGYLRVNACLRLTEAFRSLPRPSSPLSA
jgi:hypothetical protein